ncbi:MAG: DUF2269 family protein [Chloroflexi bacterium]|nr:DUF2269 family protein [Chloroflexota bacterium]
MDLREILLVGHILGVVVMGFGSGTAMLSSLTAGRNPDVREIVRTVELEQLGGRVTSVAAVVVLLLGTWLVIESDVYDFSQAWISASYAAWFVAMAIGGIVMGRHGRRVLTEARAALARGETHSDRLVAQFNAPIAKIGGTLLGLMYVVLIWLMVAKPGL